MNMKDCLQIIGFLREVRDTLENLYKSLICLKEKFFLWRLEMMFTQQRLEYECIYSKYIWHIFDQKGLEDFFSHS